MTALIADLSHIVESVDYPAAPPTDIAWLTDPDDWPLMQTALAAQAVALVTDNSRDFPLGKHRNGVLVLGSTPFHSRLFQRFPDTEADIWKYFAGTSSRS